MLSALLLALFLPACEIPTLEIPPTEIPPIENMYEDTPDAVEAYTLSAPTNLQATAFDGYVWLSWNPVANAQEYAVYRSLPTQTGVDADQDTAFQFLGTVDARDPNVYTTHAATVGGGTTYLDYVNLDNSMEPGNYTYSVAAMRHGDDESIIMYADSQASSSIEVTVASVPNVHSRLDAPATVDAQYEPGVGLYHIGWPKNPLAQGYLVFELDTAGEFSMEDLLSALAVADPDLRDEALFDLGGLTLVAPPGADVEIWTYLWTENAIYYDAGGENPDLIFGVVSIPQDEYFRPSNLTMQEMPMSLLYSLTASMDHETEIILIWDAIPGADDYEVYRSEDGYTGWTQLTTVVDDFIPYGTAGSQVWFVDDDPLLEAGTVDPKYYYYRVRAVFGTDTGAYSPIAAGYITTLTGPTYLGTPVLTATDGIFSDKIELTWPEVDGADQYIIYRSDSDNGTYNLLIGPQAFAEKEAIETTFFYEDTDVEAGINATDRLYWYKMVAVNTAFGTPPTTIYSAMSTANSGYVAPNTVVVDPADLTLAAPSIQFYQQGVGTDRISIQWANVTEDTETGALAAEGYELYYSTTTGSEYTHVVTIDGTTTGAALTYTGGITTGATLNGTVDTGFDIRIILNIPGFPWEKGVDYFFTMKSTNSTENMVSDLSAETSNWLDGLEPAVMEGSWVEITDILTVGMNEEVVGADSDAYELVISTNNDLSVVLDRVDVETILEDQTLPIFDLDDLLAGAYEYDTSLLGLGTTYYYGIRAFNSTLNEWSYSNVLSFTTPAI